MKNSINRILILISIVIGICIGLVLYISTCIIDADDIEYVSEIQEIYEIKSDNIIEIESKDSQIEKVKEENNDEISLQNKAVIEEKETVLSEKYCINNQNFEVKRPEVVISDYSNEVNLEQNSDKEITQQVNGKVKTDEPLEIKKETDANVKEETIKEVVNISELLKDDTVILEPPKEENTCVVMSESGVSSSMTSAVYNNYLLAPQGLRNSFESNGWKVIISKSSLGPRYGYSFSILALTCFGEKRIYIDNRKSAENSVLHELGHYLDYLDGFASSKDEFHQIYSDEVNNFVSFWSTHKNNTSTAIEYFAESFQVLMLQPDTLKEKCPKTYEFLRSIENEIF